MSTSLPFPEYDQLDGLALADLIRRGEVSAAAVTEAAISRMAARNPALNAIVRPLEAYAREMVRQHPADAPFAAAARHP